MALKAYQDSGGSVKAMAEAVVLHAQRQRTKDDVTVIVIKLSSVA